MSWQLRMRGARVCFQQDTACATAIPIANSPPPATLSAGLLYLLDANPTDFNLADVKHEEEGQRGGHQNSDVTTDPPLLDVCFSDGGDSMLLVLPATGVDHPHLFGSNADAESR